MSPYVVRIAPAPQDPDVSYRHMDDTRRQTCVGGTATKLICNRISRNLSQKSADDDGVATICEHNATLQ